MSTDHQLVLAEAAVALKIAQPTDIFGPRQGESDLLEGFTLGRGSGRRIDCLESSARKGHMPGPGIPRPGCPLDKENFWSLAKFAQHHGHRSAIRRLEIDPIGLEEIEALSDLGNLRHGLTIARWPGARPDGQTGKMDFSDQSPSLPVMEIQNKPAPNARQLLKLAERDLAQARSELQKLSDEEQVATLCEAPVAMRVRLLELVERPEKLIPLIPEAELCFTCKQVGVSDSSWILTYATSDQIIACIDLDAWSGLKPEITKLDQWIAALAEAGEESLLRASQAMDPEMVALYLREHADVELKPSGDEDWQPPEGGQTIEGQFYVIARADNDDLAPLLKLLNVLFQRDYWLYFRMMQSVREESTTEIIDWALRWRTNRLEDLGFPSWDRSMAIYGHIRPDRLPDLPDEAIPHEGSAWDLPVWITALPAASEQGHLIFRAVAELEIEERARFFYAFLSLANRVAVADRRDLGDSETLPATMEKAARVASLGLEHIAQETGLSVADVLRRASVTRLFRVGVNLAPEGVRPRFAEEDEDDAETENGGEAAP